MFKFRLLLSAMAIAVCLAAIQLQSAPPVAAAAVRVEAGPVLSFATNQLHKPFKLGANGMHRFDCSGLVYRTFLEEGLAARIGGQRRARGYYHWFKSHGQVTNNPQKGDLVVWARKGHRVSHVGIFYGYNRNGKPLAISALTTGVAIHKVFGINKPFKAYLHVQLGR